MKSSIAPAILISAAILLALPGVYAQSIPAATRAVPSPVDVRAQALEIAKIRELQQLRRREEALRAARRAVRKFPENTQLRFLLGVTLSEAGNPQDAIETFERLNLDHPELAEPYNNLAVLHAANGDLDAARDALVAAIRVAPNYPLALQNLGDVYLRMAERSYQRAVESKGATVALKRKLTRVRAVVESLTSDP
ncbi:MAG: tetratricopeptide repeat protein [Burkholderiaceae bacterium]